MCIFGVTPLNIHAGRMAGTFVTDRSVSVIETIFSNSRPFVGQISLLVFISTEIVNLPIDSSFTSDLPLE